MSSNASAKPQPAAPTFPANFVPPASKPYIYNPATNTYTKVG
ncbi:MAG: hypothetical protein NWE96_04150 [Candidatus Bathyarchaeota archaeon]|nr:hypothetical protein [Candidatus Bathyarchaeota archaeon]